MNMPGSLSKSSYNDINKKLNSAYADSAKESIENAVQEVRDILNPNAEANDVVDSDICIDGSWQKSGHNSLNGVVTGIHIQRKQNGVGCASIFQLLSFMFQMRITERNTRVLKMESDPYLQQKS